MYEPSYCGRCQYYSYFTDAETKAQGVNCLAQSHTAGECWRWALNPGSLSTESPQYSQEVLGIPDSAELHIPRQPGPQQLHGARAPAAADPPRARCCIALLADSHKHRPYVHFTDGKTEARRRNEAGGRSCAQSGDLNSLSLASPCSPAPLAAGPQPEGL